MVFLLILHSQIYPDKAKASTHQYIYIYTIYRSAAAFYECLITVVIALFRTTATQKFFLYYPLLVRWVAFFAVAFTNESPILFS